MPAAESSWSNMTRELENQKFKHPYSLTVLPKTFPDNFWFSKTIFLFFPRARTAGEGRTRGLRLLGAEPLPWGAALAELPEPQGSRNAGRKALSTNIFTFS